MCSFLSLSDIRVLIALLTLGLLTLAAQSIHLHVLAKLLHIQISKNCQKKSIWFNIKTICNYDLQKPWLFPLFFPNRFHRFLLDLFPRHHLFITRKSLSPISDVITRKVGRWIERGGRGMLRSGSLALPSYREKSMLLRQPNATTRNEDGYWRGRPRSYLDEVRLFIIFEYKVFQGFKDRYHACFQTVFTACCCVF